MINTNRLVARIARDLIELRDLSDCPVREQLAIIASSAVASLYDFTNASAGKRETLKPLPRVTTQIRKLTPEAWR